MRILPFVHFVSLAYLVVMTQVAKSKPEPGASADPKPFFFGGFGRGGFGRRGFGRRYGGFGGYGRGFGGFGLEGGGFRTGGFGFFG